MGKPRNPNKILFKNLLNSAAAAEIGIVIETPDPVLLRRRLASLIYAQNKKSAFETGQNSYSHWQELSLQMSPDSPTELWIVRREKLEEFRNELE